MNKNKSVFASLTGITLGTLTGLALLSSPSIVVAEEAPAESGDHACSGDKGCSGDSACSGDSGCSGDESCSGKEDK